MEEYDNQNAPAQEHDNEAVDTAGSDVPVGIARIRDEWREFGLVEIGRDSADDVQPVVFPEVDGGAGIGDYALDCESVTEKLGLPPDAVDRPPGRAELDSILVQSQDGSARRLISESSVERFQADSAIDPSAITRAAKAMADKTIAASIDDLRAEIEDLKATQGKLLLQMKDMLLLEVRNLKEQDRDLASYVFEMVEEIRSAFPKKKR